MVPGPTTGPSGSRARLDCRKHAFGRKRDFGQPHADCIMDRIGDRARNPEHTRVPDAFGPKWTGAAILENDGFVVVGKIGRVRHAIVERRRIHRLATLIAQLLEEALPQRLKYRTLDLTAASNGVDAASGIGSDRRLRPRHPPSSASRTSLRRPVVPSG